jgi:hypothetical protein
MYAPNATTGKVGQPVSRLAAALDVAELDERNALAAHDVARAALRSARSHYRNTARAAMLAMRKPLTLPTHPANARRMIDAARDRLTRMRGFYDGLVALDEIDRAVIDAAVEVERAELDLDDLTAAEIVSP